MDYRCVGPECEKTDHYCIAACPQQALSLMENPSFATLGDCRWTPDLIASNWQMAETGRAPRGYLESEIGASGGGFDRLRFRRPAAQPAGFRREDISTQLVLNRRNDSRPKIAIDVPWYGGGMSFGSTNIRVLLGKARVAKAFHSFTCTARAASGAIHSLCRSRDHPGGHGTLRRPRRDDPAGADRGVQICPGAKPGPGADTCWATRTRRPWRPCGKRCGNIAVLAVPFHSVYSVEDHKKHLDWIAHVTRGRCCRRRSPPPATSTWLAWGSITPAPISSISTAAMGGTGAAPTSP